jgi:hypothetical protein
MERLPEIENMYEMMSETGREYLFGMARQLLRSFPAKKAKPSLAAAEAASKVELFDNKPNSVVYKFPLVGVSQPVDGKEANVG